MPTPTDHQPQTAAAVLALRDLVLAICAGREDGAALVERHRTEGTLHVVLDEGEGLLVFGRRGPDGAITWTDSVRCDPRDPTTFGKTPAQIERAAMPTMH